jgi:sigma-B regulation protein RsbU (phosphoserine phosphatase)
MGLELFSAVPVTEVTFEPGDRLLLYTDGVSELFSEVGDPYGEERLVEQFQAVARAHPDKILEAIIADLASFAGNRLADDDQAMLLIVAE